MAVALKTLAVHGGGRLVVSGYQGEAERLAALAPEGTLVSIEPTARSTFENVERSLPLLLDVQHIAIASDRGHRRRAASNLRSLRPDLASRLVEPDYTWRDGWWMDAAGTAYEWVLRIRWARAERRRSSAVRPTRRARFRGPAGATERRKGGGCGLDLPYRGDPP